MMEFLVRLTDKTSERVFCMDASHAGEHMDRVSFLDDTHKASCPVCKKSHNLIRKNDSCSKKGHFVTYKPDGWTWGTNERKHYGIVKIECSKADADRWCETIRDGDAMEAIRTYDQLLKQRIAALVEEDYTGDEIKQDAMVLQYQAQRVVAENIDSRAYRHRKYAFDFEMVLAPDRLANWNDVNVSSYVIFLLPNEYIPAIKELEWL